MLIILAVIMLVLLMMGYPMMVPLAVGTLFMMFTGLTFFGPDQAVTWMVNGVGSWVLAAVPMFIFAADILTKGHTANRLLDLVDAFTRHLRGGLPITTAASCAVFGAVSGSTQATVVAMGGPMRPRLLAKGYSDSFALALIINASDIALLIPPSIGFIVYGVVMKTSIGDLFLAGILPGLLVLLMFSVYCWIGARVKGIEPEERASWGDRLKAMRGAILPLGFPILVVGGIYGGWFSAVEASAIAVAYALLLEVVIFRKVSVKDLGGLALSSGMITAVVFILVAIGAAFSHTLGTAGIPEKLLGPAIESIGQNQVAALALIAVAFFIGCMFVDPIVVILILVPIFKPLIESANLDPIHVGVIVTLQAAIGSATPPFGCDIFTAIAVFRRPYLEVIRGTPPFIFMLLIATFILILFPQLSLWLPALGG
ncbi:MAG: C4-dicarboxylate ABC transporter permease [Alcanivorax borkumensis]|uniref:TRAP transporter large permease protein n=1 Tax=Alcanivorax borkumensis (strain ATCC 700651 / DSM 11573 / NCIMB 13689 / SK2) TaxID=393595 RepID=Q0VMK3_ALCBS|nr:MULTISPECIES: TRAP transporter large permease [Alcanivorax]OJH07280.1 MAG: C4-dicarboxylate ABC transporter permease [Alcanivorax borkumensis]EUC68577.1 C4-dicarboxylate ABC transporter permease [Alcanivorax sp. 97CO-5]PKG00978.1 TRAP transporter large permease [Alcanivorax sp. 97CO-6]CAL17595.1 TRAP-type C4-dicarboxylate transport system,large permease component [Alcanivorax borkumensis SK2]BAP15051.1 putative C4-dicarboxylate transport protein [Alcanivorax sp. NBRC 101098]